ncbi:hypothetical protein [Planococcus wigleyi]|uniref:Uncharacterized protein n=1 Tax=Planococcus wigleyi TaxID=2762216 RepID=A0ABR8WDJ3_9BACL|nr:hypothetical protein [Planococcus wigleyi]MBD8015042.1 hypothetical protein [Planococcus wigleyi]
MANGFLSIRHLRNLYIIGVVLQIFLTLVFLLLGAAIISDISYMYDRQMFYGSEETLVIAFWKSMIPSVGIYILLMLILHYTFKYNYKRKKKEVKRQINALAK